MKFVTTFTLNKKELEYIQFALKFTLEEENKTQTNMSNEWREGLEILLRDIRRIDRQLNQKKTLDLNDPIKKNFLNGSSRFFATL